MLYVYSMQITFISDKLLLCLNFKRTRKHSSRCVLPASNRACFGGRGRGVKYLEGYLYNPLDTSHWDTYHPPPDVFLLRIPTPSPNGPRTKDFYPSLPSRDLGLQIPTPLNGPGTRDAYSPERDLGPEILPSLTHSLICIRLRY